MLKKTLLILCSLVFVLASISFTQEIDVEGRVVFVSNRSGYDNLWILDLETYATYPLTDFPGPEGIIRILETRWSPNGKMIAFVGNTGGTYGYELFIINDDGTGIKQLTDYSSSSNYVRYPCWDPNTSDYVYYSKAWPATKTIVHRVNIDTLEDIEIPNFRGSNSRLWDITSDGLEYLFGRELSCCWTPSQYTGYQDMNGTYERIIKPSDGYSERIGRINREDNWIVYAESHGSSGAYPPDNIYKMDENGNFVTQLTYGIGSEANRYPVWTLGDNSGFIIFESNHFGNYEIVMMKAEAVEYPSGLINLTLDPSSDRYPDWTRHKSKRRFAILFDDFSYSPPDELLGESNWPGHSEEYKMYGGSNVETTNHLGESVLALKIEENVEGKGPNDKNTSVLFTHNFYNEGIYAAKVWFDDDPYSMLDEIVETFYTISDYNEEANKEYYAECDFEYLPFNFWSSWSDPTLWLVTYDTASKKDLNPERSSLGGKWLGLMLKVIPNKKVEYFVYDCSGTTPNLLKPYTVGKRFGDKDLVPEMNSKMQIHFGMWVNEGTTTKSEYTMYVDWMVHIQDLNYDWEDVDYGWNDVVKLVENFRRPSGLKRFDTTIPAKRK